MKLLIQNLKKYDIHVQVDVFSVLLVRAAGDSVATDSGSTSLDIQEQSIRDNMNARFMLDCIPAISMTLEDVPQRQQDLFPQIKQLSLECSQFLRGGRRYLVDDSWKFCHPLEVGSRVSEFVNAISDSGLSVDDIVKLEPLAPGVYIYVERFETDRTAAPCLSVRIVVLADTACITIAGSPYTPAPSTLNNVWRCTQELVPSISHESNERRSCSTLQLCGPEFVTAETPGEPPRKKLRTSLSC